MIRFVGLAVLALGVASAGAAGLEGRSSTSVEKKPDGYQTVSVENTIFIPYAVFRPTDSSYALRIATLLTRFKFATGQEPAPFDATVTVSVDDMSGPAPRRMANFTDPGAEGRILADRYFVTTRAGCCDELFTHHVRLLETGKHLFRSTGRGDGRGIGWMDIPNSPIRRWAAIDGVTTPEEYKRGILGRLRYGSDHGTAATIELSVEPGSKAFEALAEGFGHGTDVVWADRGRTLDPPGDPSMRYRPAAGRPESPHSIWSLDGIKDPGRVGGFDLVLQFPVERGEPEPFAIIPIDGDRPIPGKARTMQGLTLKPVPE